jgi:YidC/Oxa1 family membrane protein insertase
MPKNLLNLVLFFVLAGGLIAGWYYLDKQVPPKEPPDEKKLALAKTPKEAVAAVGGMGGLSAGPLASLPSTIPLPKSEKLIEKPKPAEPPKPAGPTEPHELTALGGDDFFLKVLLNSKGAGVQQLILTQFDEADRVGREVREADGSPRRLHLIPGFHRPLLKKIMEQPEYVPLHPGPVDLATNALLNEPAYTIYHYPAEDDPARQPRDADRMNDEFPSPELGIRTWKKVRDEKSEDTHTVAFETELATPYHLRLRKTFSVKKGEYHLGFKVEIEPLKDHVAGKGKLRYQLVGPRGLPIEGEWYTTTFRNVYVGRVDSRYKDRTSRDVEDAATINQSFGSAKYPKPDGKLTYAGVGTQFFAGVIALDQRENLPVEGYWDYCRGTRETWQNRVSEMPQLDDVTVRAVTPVLDVDKPLAHHYVLYHGPIKVRQLGQMRHVKTGAAVDDALVDWYADTLGLKTLTDYHSPNALGRFANSIYWSDLLIASTNVMHGVLGFLNRIVPVWGIDIMLLTVLVRCLLLIPSRKQQMVAAKMSAKIQALQPEIDKLKAKYGDDFNTFNQEKTKLLLKNKAINPAAQMGGCLLIILQMPVFMGLYFCLQESVFFRLEPFLFGWIPNLAAPDMTVYWTESIPVISDPSYRTGILSFLYLGPFFNLLPILTVSLMAVNQKLTMPPPTDDMQKQQYKIMQWMMVLMGLFFYKVAAGLCVYFLCSSVWSLVERKLLPKPKVAPMPDVLPGPTAAAPPSPSGGGGYFARLRAKVEEMQKQAEAQAARQIRNAPTDRRNKKKRK